MNRLKATSKDEQFVTSAIYVTDPQEGQELPAPSSNFKLSVTPEGELIATIEMPIPIVDVVAIVGSIKLMVDQYAGTNDDMYVRKALILLGETGCPKPKVRLHFPDGFLYSGHVYAAATGEELYGCLTGFDLAVYKPNQEKGLYQSVFTVDLEMYVSSLDTVLNGLDPDMFIVSRDDQGASVAIAAAKEND